MAFIDKITLNLSIMNPLHPDGDNRSCRDMGFRPAGLFSLTGHVDNLRQSDPSAPARYMQPPSETDSFRHPGYAPGRESLISSVGSLSSAKVEGSHSADSNSLTDVYNSATWKMHKKKLCLY